MKNEDVLHAQIEGVLTPDLVGCTRKPIVLANVATTKVLDDVTCPACRIAMVQRGLKFAER